MNEDNARNTLILNMLVSVSSQTSAILKTIEELNNHFEKENRIFVNKGDDYRRPMDYQILNSISLLYMQGDDLIATIFPFQSISSNCYFDEKPYALELEKVTELSEEIKLFLEEMKTEIPPRAANCEMGVISSSEMIIKLSTIVNKYKKNIEKLLPSIRIS